MNKQENNKSETSYLPMCKGRDCPLTESCYRYTADVSKYQSYFTESPFKDGRCEMYWGEHANQIHNELKNIINGI